MYSIERYESGKWYNVEYADDMIAAMERGPDFMVRSLNVRILDPKGRVVADSLNADYELRED